MDFKVMQLAPWIQAPWIHIGDLCVSCKHGLNWIDLKRFTSFGGRGLQSKSTFAKTSQDHALPHRSLDPVAVRSAAGRLLEGASKGPFVNA